MSQPINYLSGGESNFQIVETFIAGAAIGAGDVVKFDTAQTGSDRAIYCIKGIADGLAFGIALEAATAAGQRIRVAVKGYVEDAITDGAVGITNSLVCDANSDLTKYLGTETYAPFAVALETNTGTAADVMLFGICF